MKDHEDLDRILSDISFRTNEMLCHTEHYKDNLTNWHEAWRYSYRAEEELRQIAVRFREASLLVVDLRVRAIGSVTPEDAGYITRKVLKDYLGHADAFYSEVYAGLGDTILKESSPEAQSLAVLLNARLACVEKLSPEQQRREVEALDLIASALTFRASPSVDRREAFLSSLKDILLSRIEKSSVILELLNEVWSR